MHSCHTANSINGSEAWTLNKQLGLQDAASQKGNVHLVHETREERRGCEKGWTGNGTNGSDEIKQTELLQSRNKARQSEKNTMLGIMSCMRRQDGQRKQRIDDVIGWSGKGLVEMVQMTENRKEYRCFIHIWHSNLPVPIVIKEMSKHG